MYFPQMDGRVVEKMIMMRHRFRGHEWQSSHGYVDQEVAFSNSYPNPDGHKLDTSWTQDVYSGGRLAWISTNEPGGVCRSRGSITRLDG